MTLIKYTKADEKNYAIFLIVALIVAGFILFGGGDIIVKFFQNTDRLQECKRPFGLGYGECKESCAIGEFEDTGNADCSEGTVCCITLEEKTNAAVASKGGDRQNNFQITKTQIANQDVLVNTNKCSVDVNKKTITCPANTAATAQFQITVENIAENTLTITPKLELIDKKINTKIQANSEGYPVLVEKGQSKMLIVDFTPDTKEKGQAYEIRPFADAQNGAILKTSEETYIISFN